MLRSRELLSDPANRDLEITETVSFSLLAPLPFCSPWRWGWTAFSSASTRTRWPICASHWRRPRLRLRFKHCLLAQVWALLSASIAQLKTRVMRSQRLRTGLTTRLPSFCSRRGLLGALFGGAFLIWFYNAASNAWTHPKGSDDAELVLLNRASVLVVLLLLLHSLVDYPLRTGAMSAIFAFFCALLTAPAQPAPTVPPKRGSLREKERKVEGVRMPKG